jgi:hypothetical protein
MAYFLKPHLIRLKGIENFHVDQLAETLTVMFNFDPREATTPDASAAVENVQAIVAQFTVTGTLPGELSELWKSAIKKAFGNAPDYEQNTFTQFYPAPHPTVGPLVLP